MPVAASRRSRHSRADSDVEDNTQAGPSTQDDLMDADGEDEPRVAKREKGVVAAANGAVVAANGAAANGAVDDDDDRPIDIENFQDQPLRREQLQGLHGMASDWSSVQDSTKAVSANLFKDIATGLIDSEAADLETNLKSVEALLREVIDIQAEMSLHEECLRNMQQNGLRGEDVNNVADTYLSTIREQIEQYQTKTSRQKYAQDAQYMAYHEAVFDAQHEGEAMPTMNDFIPREDGDKSDDDDEVEIGGVTQMTTCPLSLKPLKDPMTCSLCKHSYDAQTLRGYFAGTRGRQSCPVSGCNQTFTLADCFVDHNLKRKVLGALKRRQRREDSDSEAEEIVE